MGTNFYLFTKDKETAKTLAPYDYDLTDNPDFGYRIHIAKTSMGWLPLFQAHKDGIASVVGYLNAITSYKCKIYDEYGTEYLYDDFVDRVLNFNGGIIGGVEPTYIGAKQGSMNFYDANMPDYRPISHIAGNKQSYNFSLSYQNEYFTDKNGYEFTWRGFS